LQKAAQLGIVTEVGGGDFGIDPDEGRRQKMVLNAQPAMTPWDTFMET
jgi:hypothetical protein